MFKMAKKGFTLIEILISLALVGILIAVISPNLAKVLPDKRKAMFIKAFTKTEIAVAAMLSDPDMYRNRYNFETQTFDQYGLCNINTPQGLLAATNNLPPSGVNKFAFYLTEQLGGMLNGDNINTSDGLIYTVIWDDANSNSTVKDAHAATISVGLNDDSTAIATFEVRNDGVVHCGSDTTCDTYLKDRFNLKKKS